ncbi:hypothetical protein SFRURICE_008749 [Spodoptera frugiperda]|nr:hypothetical protein SFRURICE_008749 [Spodoptera frugiperda]
MWGLTKREVPASRLRTDKPLLNSSIEIFGNIVKVQRNKNLLCPVRKVGTHAISRTRGSSFSSAMAVAPDPFTMQGRMDTTHDGNMPHEDLFLELKPLYQTGRK